MTINNYLHYLCTQFGNAPSIGKERLQNTMFLVAWKTSLNPDQTFSKLDWIHTERGPYSKAVEQAFLDPRLQVQKFNVDGSLKERITLLSSKIDYDLSTSMKKVIEAMYVLTVTKNFSELTNLVFSTYPLLVTEVGDRLDLSKLAKDYMLQRTGAPDST